MKKGTLKSLSVIAGILLAIAIACSNVFQFSQKTKNEKAKTEQQTSDEHQVVFSVTSVTPPIATCLQLVSDIHYLFEIASSSEKPCSAPVEKVFLNQRLLLTLFRVIISPNAP